MKQNTLTNDQMRKLRELGINTNNASCVNIGFVYNEDDDDAAYYDTFFKNIHNKDTISCNPLDTYTLSDLLSMFRPELTVNDVTYRFMLTQVCVGYYRSDCAYASLVQPLITIPVEHNNITEAVYNLLVTCISNGYYKNDKRWIELFVNKHSCLYNKIL